MTSQCDISVLLPSRGRTHILKRSIESMVSLADNADQIRFFVGLDQDDAVGKDYFLNVLQEELNDQGIEFCAMEFAPMGYHNIHRYVNAMAKRSDSRWFVLWNDDAVMETAGWDTEICQHRSDLIQLLAFHTHRDHPYSIFPVVPRSWVDCVGHFSLHHMYDAWLSQIAYMLDVWKRIDVHVLHDRHDLTGNNKDSTFKQRVSLEGRPQDPRDFHHISMLTQRWKETESLAAAMSQLGQDVSWWNAVRLGQQDPWEKLAANDVNQQMRQFRAQYL